MQETPQSDPLVRKYWCFISYRHKDNSDEGRQWASWLHQQLETYEVPADLVGKRNEHGDIIPAHIYPVFRDEDEMAAGDLGERITRALDHSTVSNTATTWQTYTLSLTAADLVAGGQNGFVVSTILGDVVQVSLRHDPSGSGPGNPSPVASPTSVWFDDLTLLSEP